MPIPTCLCKIIREYILEFQQFPERFNRCTRQIHALTTKLMAFIDSDEIIKERLQLVFDNTNFPEDTYERATQDLQHRIGMCYCLFVAILKVKIELESTQSIKPTIEVIILCGQQRLEELIEYTMHIGLLGFRNTLNSAVENYPYEEWLVERSTKK